MGASVAAPGKPSIQPENGAGATRERGAAQDALRFRSRWNHDTGELSFTSSSTASPGNTDSASSGSSDLYGVYFSNCKSLRNQHAKILKDPRAAAGPGPPPGRGG